MRLSRIVEILMAISRLNAGEAGMERDITSRDAIR